MVPGLQILHPDMLLPVPTNISSWMDCTPYRSLIGSLNYLAVATQPDISFTVGHLASVLDCYQPEHWDAAIRVVQYLKGTCLLTLDLGGTNPIHALGYSDSDYNNCPNTSQSIGDYCFSLGAGMISWASHKHTMPPTPHATPSMSHYMKLLKKFYFFTNYSTVSTFHLPLLLHYTVIMMQHNNLLKTRNGTKRYNTFVSIITPSRTSFPLMNSKSFIFIPQTTLQIS